MTNLCYVFPFLLLHVAVTQSNVISSREQAYANCVCNISLLTADCSHRNLSRVPDDLPSYIQILNMEGNNLTKLGPGEFRKYKNLTHLNLEGNHLNLVTMTYDPHAFLDLESVHVLKVASNCNSSSSTSLSYSYPDQALSKLTSLRELTIDGIPNAIFNEGFQNLTKLKNITFCGNCHLKYINGSMFNNTPHLMFLNMSKCRIYDIHEDAFSPLTSINTIDLSRNEHLGFLNVTASTKGLQGSSIRVMNVSRIVRPFSVGVILQNNTFVYLQNTNITELQNNHNWIEILEPGTLNYYPKSLKTLSVSDNRFMAGQYLCDAMHMKGLQNIDVSDMAISHNFLPSLQQRSGYGNQDKWVFQGPPDLESITARNYLLGGHIYETFYNASRIKYLDISHNAITEWIGPVHYFTTLTHADFSNCFCSKVASTFFPSFPNLIFLNVSYNLIGDTLMVNNQSIFHNLTFLEVLDLSTNKILSLHHKVFESNHNLKYLNLSNNEIWRWTFDISEQKHLVELNIAHNELRTIWYNYRTALNAISHNLSLDLSGNSFWCTCENINFLSWLSHSKINLKNTASYKCVNVDDVDIKLTLSVISSLENKCKPFFAYICFGMSGIVLFLAVSGMGLVYRYRWKLKYLYYVARDRYRPVRTQGNDEDLYEFDAFVSCSDEDLSFAEILLNHLEGQGRHLCVHHRDFRPGEPIASNIVRAIQRSRRTLIILSHNFLSSTWCRYEFEMAKMEAVHEERNVVLVVKIGEIDSVDMPRELMYMMRTDSYAEFPEKTEDQRAFWANLNLTLSN